jgi:hypothetical protein
MELFRIIRIGGQATYALLRKEDDKRGGLMLRPGLRFLLLGGRILLGCGFFGD